MPVATAKTVLTVEDRKLQRGLRRGEKSVRNYGATVAKTMGAAKIAFAAAAVAIGFLSKKFVDAASNFEEVKSKFDAVFKDLTPEAEKFVDTLSSELGRSRTQLTEFMATLQDTFVPLGFARDEGLEMSKTLTQLTLDLASFNNKAEPDVLRDLQSAIVGNVETMRKYGVIINQASLNQELLNMGVSGGAKSATEAQKAQARLNMIMAATSDAQGDAERTGGSYANQVRRMRAAFENLSVTIGNELMPAAKAVVGWVTSMTESMTAQIPAIKKWISDVSEGASIVWNKFVQGALVPAMKIGAMFASAFETIFNNFGDVVDLGVSSALFSIVKFVNDVVHFFTSTVPEALIWFGRNWQNILQEVAAFTATVFSNMWDNIKSFFQNVQIWLSGGTTDWKFKGLTDGFNLTLDELPKFAERLPTELEKQLRRRMLEAGDKVGGAYSATLNEHLDRIDARFGTIKKQAEEAEAKSKQAEAQAKTKAGDRAERKKDLKASFEGLAESWKRITTAATGKDDSKENIKKTAHATEMMWEQEKEAARVRKESLNETKKIRIAFDQLAFGGQSAFAQ